MHLFAQSMETSEPVRTALYGEHLKLNGNIVDFHGFELPIWYTSITQEHLACRRESGIFDVSHMGVFRFSGHGVKQWLEGLASQQVTAIESGRCAYTHFMDESGCIIDDMIFAVTSDEEILGVPNASMIEVMKDWFDAHLREGITLENLSSEYSIIALQGPTSKDVCEKVLGKENHVGRFKWKPLSTNELGIGGWIQGTGYTGEKGYEIFIPNQQAPLLWSSLVAAGSTPIGLGARDTLRLEKGYLLSGQDFAWSKLNDDSFLHRDSWETNVPFGLHLDHDFIGKEKVVSHGTDDARWWGLVQLEKGPMPRPGKEILSLGGEVSGRLTSGAPSPSLDRTGIGMGYIKGVSAGDEVLIQSSPKKRIRAKVVRPPFV